jgi:hypothetical protein
VKRASFLPDYDRLSLENLHQLRRLCDRGDPDRLAAIDGAINRKLGKAPGSTAKGGARAGISHDSPEKTIVSPECDELLERLGFEIVKFDQPFRTKQTPGISDRYVRHPRYKWRGWIEYKHGYNRPTEDQEAFIAGEIAAGGVAFPAWCVEDVIAGLREYGYPGPLPATDPERPSRGLARKGNGGGVPRTRRKKGGSRG